MWISDIEKSRQSDSTDRMAVHGSGAAGTVCSLSPYTCWSLIAAFSSLWPYLALQAWRFWQMAHILWVLAHLCKVCFVVCSANKDWSAILTTREQECDLLGSRHGHRYCQGIHSAWWRMRKSPTLCALSCIVKGNPSPSPHPRELRLWYPPAAWAGEKETSLSITSVGWENAILPRNASSFITAQVSVCSIWNRCLLICSFSSNKGRSIGRFEGISLPHLIAPSPCRRTTS